MFLRKQLTIFLICIGFLLFLTACKDKLGPAAYDEEGFAAPSFTDVLGKEGGELLSVELPADEDEGGQEGTQPDPAADPDTDHETTVYTYHKLPEGGLTVEGYVETMTAQEIGYLLVNAAGKPAEPPDYTALEGHLILARLDPSTKTILRLGISWAEDSCTVKVSRLDERHSSYVNMANPQRQQGEVGHRGEGTSAVPEVPPGVSSMLSAEEAVAFIQKLHPSVLGLSGENMDQYRVYFMDGKAMVDGKPCMRLEVYGISDPEGSNAFAGFYLLTSTCSNLYRLDRATNEVTELTLPFQAPASVSPGGEAGDLSETEGGADDTTATENP